MDDEADEHIENLRKTARFLADDYAYNKAEELTEAVNFIRRQEDQLEIARRALRTIAGTASDKLQAIQAAAALPNIGADVF